MTNEAKHNNKRRRRRGGVPTALVVILLTIAIVMGGLMGFVIARRTAPADSRLAQANERIIELENTLSLIGFPVDGDPEAWVFDDSVSSGNAADDLAGAATEGGDDGEDLWTEDESLLTGTLTEGGDPVVVAEFDGGQLLSTEVIPEFNDQLTTQIFAGYSAEEVSDSVLQTVLSDMAAKKLIAQKAKELGLDAVTDDEEKDIQAQAKERYDSQIAYYTAFVDRDGLTPEQISAAAEQYMKDEAHVTLESIAAELRAELPAKKYYDYVVKDITVDDAAVQTHYDERLAAQKTAFSEYPEEFEYAHTSGRAILYVPEGYRAVLDLLLPFDDDATADSAATLTQQLEALDPMNDADRIKAIDAELDPLYAPLEAKANEIAEKLKAGESFRALLEQYGGDDMMNAEPLRSEGYYISDHTYLFSAEFVQGSMILDAPGQVSSPLRSASGLHMVQYLKDVAPGEVPLEDVYDAMKAETLKDAQDAYYEEQVTQLLEDANVKYYPERLQ
ncbi:MAG: hypothetical protein IJ646_07355 [Clostridia bacterium]|nr:hypothetical protein [Clostridia bacterium]